MQILSGDYFAVAVACVAVGIERGMVALRVLDRRLHLLFGATAAAAAVVPSSSDPSRPQPLLPSSKRCSRGRRCRSAPSCPGVVHRRSNLALKERIEPENEYKDIVGTSDAMRYVLHKIEQVAGTDATVLIQGETGVGKELVARTIHEQSERSSGAFVAVNCAALAPSVIESELFGHEKGSFTGADRQRKGRFELADGGTLFLDEVGELPLEVQPKLLRVLERGEFERIGGTRTESTDVRIIAATNRDLRADVAAGRFREDLFYRLEVYPITVPPLRDRREDIALLVERFVRRLNEERRTDIRKVPPEVLRRLEAYSWPGNVSELANVIEGAVLTSRDNVLRLAEPLPDPEPLPARRGGGADDGKAATLDEVTAADILAVVKRCEAGSPVPAAPPSSWTCTRTRCARG